MANLAITATFVGQADLVAPILSAPLAAGTGTTSASWAVTTDEAGGTLFAALYPAASPAPSKGQTENGGGAVLARTVVNGPVTGSNAGAFTTGMSAGMSYRVAFFQRDGAGNESGLVTSPAFDTQAGGGSSAWTADATGATIADVKGILDSWQANWAGTVPPGKTASDERIVQLTGPHSGNASFSGYSFPQTTWVRGAGPYGTNSSFPYNPTCGSHIAGTLSQSNCTNLGFALITCEFHSASGCTGMKWDRVSSHSRWSTVLSSPPSGVDPQFSNCPGAVISRCHFAGFDAYCLAFTNGSAGTILEECYFEQSRNDYVKIPGTGDYTNMIVRRNVFGRFSYSAAGAHTDCWQAQNGDTAGLLFWGNLLMQAGWLNNKAMQFFWNSNSNTGSNVVSTQNISASRHKNCHAAPPSGSGEEAFNNSALFCQMYSNGAIQDESANAPGITNGWANRSYNFSCKLNAGSPDTAGTGGVNFHIDDVFNQSIAANMSGHEAYFTRAPADDDDISALKPLAGTAAHWAFGGQKIGAWQRSEEIWVDKKIHSQAGWPVAAPFVREYDPGNSIGTSFTGAFDADGGNA